MTTATYAEMTLTQHAAPADRRRPAQRTLDNDPALADVRDLIDAAGPLKLRDIAGGLSVSTREASRRIYFMTREGCLKQDEWARYRLAGPCRT